MPDTTPWALAIDFGTSNTAAATHGVVGIRPLSLETNSTTMPSAVLLAGSVIVVGRAAENQRRLHPERYEGAPKSRIGETSILLGEQLVDPVLLVSHVIASVRDKALAQFGQVMPHRLWLTHPAAWSNEKLDALVQAAVLAGFDRAAITLVAEPIAAVHHFAQAMHLAPGSRVAVFDFGGGTCDVAVLERTSDSTPGSEYRILGADGDAHLGGNDFDDRLYQWVLAELSQQGEPELLAALEAPAGLGARLTLRDAVRAAKEDVSAYPSSTIAVGAGGREAAVTITRVEYEQLIAPDVERAAVLLRRVLDATGTPPNALEALYLTGGSSRTPAVHRAVEAVIGRSPVTLDDPKLVVAEGALFTPVAGTVRATAGGATAPEGSAGGAVTAAGLGAAGVGAGAAAAAAGAVAGAATTAPPSDASRPQSGAIPVYPGSDAGGAGGAMAGGAVAGGGGAVVPPGSLPPQYPGDVWSPPPPPPRRPWYRGPLLLLPILGAVVVLIVVVSIIVTAVNLAGSGSTAGDSPAPSTSAPPESPAPAPDPEVTCWDGSTAPAGSCPAVTGAEGLEWAFDTTDADFPLACQTAPDPAAEAVTVELCSWNDIAATVELSEFATPADAAAFWDAFAAANLTGVTESDLLLTGDDVPIGTLRQGTYTANASEYQIACYTKLAMCAAIYGATDGATFTAADQRLGYVDDASIQQAIDDGR
ncbi:Hsp70 family protein [Herbiconiux daphne]|uniref:Hsp70 family protein n=1 Tax=Herbiconiux daphne TaxID=2970914 RepID=A0ABT2GXG2_9MICO|nr:Hsp70 family protein [Herbiconiux daphne]MCS5732653.1 Hsp70 family protein [Herbiconiux daphne]